MTNPEPRTVTLEQINAEIASEHYFTGADGSNADNAYVAVNDQKAGSAACFSDAALSLLTFCVFVLKNGFTVTGQSACADPAKFNAEMGRKLAREDAIRQCWKLFGFRLRDQIAAEKGAAPAAKRYEREDLDVTSLKWGTLPAHEDPHRGQVSYVVNMRDGRQLRGAIRLTDDRSAWPASRVAAACALDALRVANGEAQ